MKHLDTEIARPVPREGRFFCLPFGPARTAWTRHPR
jgi:hypothetical protein